MKLKSFLIIFSIVFLTEESISQIQKDAVFWSSVTIEKKINKRFSFTLMHQVAFNQNLCEISSDFTDFGGVYKLNRFLSLSANYRFIKLRNLDNDFNNLQRFYSDVIGTKSLGKFNYQLRSRIQEQLYGLNVFDPYRQSKYFIRNKITMRYSVNSRYSFHTSLEQFYRLNKLNKTQFLRADIGITYKFNLNHRIDFYYMNQISTNTKNQKLLFIYGITYGYRF